VCRHADRVGGGAGLSTNQPTFGFFFLNLRDLNRVAFRPDQPEPALRVVLDVVGTEVVPQGLE
jgi:hypothetical protein